MQSINTLAGVAVKQPEILTAHQIMLDSRGFQLMVREETAMQKQQNKEMIEQRKVKRAAEKSIKFEAQAEEI